MNVTIRKGPPDKDHPEGKVVLEVWMSLKEAQALAHKSVPCEEAIDAAMVEHLRTRFRVSRQVHTGRHPT